MSRELLKRIRQEAILPEDIDDEIQAYLAQPEPEPVAWRALNFSEHGGVYAYRDADEPFIGVNGSNVGEPLYTSPPDQSARVAELEKDNAITHENLAWYITKYREHLTEIEVLKQQLAALQVKREPLSRDEIIHIFNIADASTVSSDAFAFEFARAIEAAHGIGG